MNKLVYGLLVLSIVINVFFLTKPQEDITATEITQEAISSNDLVEPTVETIIVQDEQLKNRYKSTTEELIAVKSELTKVKNELELLNERIELTQLDEELKVPSIELDENGHPRKDVLDKFKDKKESIKALYEKEPVDSQWAYVTQDKLNQVLNEHGDTSLYEIKQLDCKSSVCKVSLDPYSTSSGSGMAAGMNAMMSFSKSKDMSGYITSFHFNDKDKENPNKVELFIARPVKP